MKKQFLFLALIVASFLTFDVSAQTTGEYQSNAVAFNWSTTASWQRWNGAAWAVPTVAEGYPGQNVSPALVTIRTGHTVTANIDVTTNDLGNLTLLGSAILNFNSNIDIDVTGALTLDGTSQITGTSSSRTLDAGTFLIQSTATNARITGIQLTISGATTVNGTLNLNSDTGTKSFNGTVSIASTGTWTSTSIVTSGRLVFGGEVLSSGTFNPGCGY